jgi:FkbM family methyltransferase
MLIPFDDCVQTFGAPFGGVLHIGAHLGEEGADYVKGGVKYVVWIEGNRTLMRHLFDATRLLPLRQAYFCEVLSDVEGEKLQFNITNNGQSSSILPLGTHKEHYPHIQVVETREVVATTFKEFYRRNIVKLELELIHMINIDVQGAELKVLKGFDDLLDSYQNIKAIYSEVNFEQVYQGAPLVEELDQYLCKFGFSRILTKTTPYGWGDALYLRR